MKIKFYNKPWPHFSIKNLLNKEDFDKVNEFSKSIEIKGKRNNIQVRNGEIYNLLCSTIEEIAQLLNINTKGLYKAVEFDVIQPNWAYNKIHNDNEAKVLTFVMALSDTGTGTHLYKTKNKNTYVKTTKWLVNGGNGFLRSDITWHDFDSFCCSEPRRTALLFLTTKEFY